MLAPKKDEKELSFVIERHGCPRYKRYISFLKPEVRMIKILKEFLEHFVQGKELSKEVSEYVSKVTDYESSASEGLLARYKNDYTMIFLDVEGLDLCGLRLTYSEEERDLLHNFYITSNNKSRSIFSSICLKIVREKQRCAIINEASTHGIIYSNFPEEDLPANSIIRYLNAADAGKIADARNIYAINSALDRGVSVDEILEVTPIGADNMFLIEKWSDYELAQIEALEPGIKNLA